MNITSGQQIAYTNVNWIKGLHHFVSLKLNSSHALSRFVILSESVADVYECD